METPFNYGKLVSGELFINRNKEKEALKQNIRSHINTILISPRRWGKSSLVSNISSELQQNSKKIRCCFIDLFSVRDEEEFYQTYATELLKQTSTKWEDWVKNGKKFLSRVTPKFQFGLNPMSDFSISFNWEEINKDYDDILNLSEKISIEKNLHIVVCIDEFQNISHFQEPLIMQKKMRSVWQKHQISTYCLYGSKRHMLANIFENKSMPFYKFGDTMFLNKISTDHWIDFIIKQFNSTGKEINVNLARMIAERMEDHPYFVQLYAAATWKLTKRKCNQEIIDAALENIKEQYSIMYQRELDTLTNMQLNYLIAMIEGVKQFSSKQTLKKYNLGAQSNITRIRTSLEKKEILDFWGKTAEFTDPVFKIWLTDDYLK